MRLLRLETLHALFPYLVVEPYCDLIDTLDLAIPRALQLCR